MRGGHLSTPIVSPLTQHRVSRREVLIGSARLGAAGALAYAAAGRFAPLAFAQDATPAAGGDYPELTVTITDQGYDLGSAEVPAGYVLLTVTNASSRPTGAAVLGPGAGQTMADLEAAAATPVPSDAFPPFFYTAAIPGGPGEIPPGGTAQAIIRLTAGDWVVIGEGDQPPSFFSATGGTPSATPEPSADVTVTEVEFGFTGLEGPLPAGPQTWKVVNAGAQPHMLVLGKVPATTTMDQIMEVVGLPEGATPAPGGLQEADFETKGGVLLQSGGTTVWPRFDLPAGRYVALCFVTDPRNGQPHAMEGMVSLFDVKSGA